MAIQAQKMMERGVVPSKFESTSSNDQRSILVHSYGGLYTQSRVETLDWLDKLEELRGADELKSKLLFSVIVVSFSKKSSFFLPSGRLTDQSLNSWRSVRCKPRRPKWRITSEESYRYHLDRQCSRPIRRLRHCRLLLRRHHRCWRRRLTIARLRHPPSRPSHSSARNVTTDSKWNRLLLCIWENRSILLTWPKTLRYLSHWSLDLLVTWYLILLWTGCLQSNLGNVVRLPLPSLLRSARQVHQRLGPFGLGPGQSGECSTTASRTVSFYLIDYRSIIFFPFSHRLTFSTTRRGASTLITTSASTLPILMTIPSKLTCGRRWSKVTTGLVSRRPLLSLERVTFADARIRTWKFVCATHLSNLFYHSLYIYIYIVYCFSIRYFFFYFYFTA